MKRTPSSDIELVETYATGSPPGRENLVGRLADIVRPQVAAMCARGPSGLAGRCEAPDLVQDVLIELVRDDARVLRRWDPDRGLSLAGFVRLVTRRYVWRRLQRVEPRTLSLDELDRSGSKALPPRPPRMEIRDDLDSVVRVLFERMSPRDRALFQRLFVQDALSEEVALEFGMSRDAIKKWRSRLYTKSRAVRTELVLSGR